MVEQLMGMVKAQDYGSLLFILGFGLLLVASIVFTVFAVTADQKR